MGRDDAAPREGVVALHYDIRPPHLHDAAYTRRHAPRERGRGRDARAATAGRTASALTARRDDPDLMTERGQAVCHLSDMRRAAMRAVHVNRERAIEYLHRRSTGRASKKKGPVRTRRKKITSAAISAVARRSAARTGRRCPAAARRDRSALPDEGAGCGWVALLRFAIARS